MIARVPLDMLKQRGHQPTATGGRSLSKSEQLAARLPALLVAAERVAATVCQGVHGRRRVGDGETFWQFRRYQPGDSTHGIDWRQSAKSDRVYVRETEWEAAQTVWLWRDGSASMRWRGAPVLPSKLERAEVLTLALAVLLARGGERFALLGTDGVPATGRPALRRLTLALDRATSQTQNLPAPAPLPKHARLVLIGDFLSPLDEAQGVVSDLARLGIRGHLVQVLDPAEQSLPFSGRILFEGTEHEGQLLFGHVDSVRSDYQRAFSRHQDGLRAVARSVNWTMVSHRTDHPPETALLALYLALTAASRW
jgi:uncharacterized protein (DUF58 family)